MENWKVECVVKERWRGDRQVTGGRQVTGDAYMTDD